MNSSVTQTLWKLVKCLLKTLAVGFGLLAIFLVIVLGLNYFGYCFREHRFPSDEEKIKSVVQSIVTNELPFRRPDVEGNAEYWVIEGKKEPVEPISYRDVEEFFALNPGCCEIRYDYINTSEGPLRFGVMNRLLGGSSGGVVIVHYRYWYRDRDGVQRSEGTTLESLQNNCGEGISLF